MERKVLYVLMLLLIGLAGILRGIVITTEYGSGADTYIGNDTQVRSTSHPQQEQVLRTPLPLQTAAAPVSNAPIFAST
jgi:hypothetical protein